LTAGTSLRLDRAVILVQIVGPDGCGKSTLSKQVVSNAIAWGITHEHIHFNLKPPQSSAASNNPHGKAEYCKPVAILAITKRYLEHQIRWLVLRKKKLIIQERGWLDQIVDPKRYRVPKDLLWLIKFLNITLPKTTLLFLAEDSEVSVSNRKKELDIFEIRRQISVWKNQNKAITLNGDLQSKISFILSAIQDELLNELSKELRYLLPAPKRLELVATKSSRKMSLLVYKPKSVKAIFSQRISLRAKFIKVHVDTYTRLAIDKCLKHLKFYGVEVIIQRSANREQWMMCITNSNLEPLLYFKFGQHGSIIHEANTIKTLPNLNGIEFPKIVFSTDLGGSYYGFATKPILDLRAVNSEEILAVNKFLTQARIHHSDLNGGNVFKTHKKYVVLDWEVIE
jgi:hypothetical protein